MTSQGLLQIGLFLCPAAGECRRIPRRVPAAAAPAGLAAVETPGLGLAICRAIINLRQKLEPDPRRPRYLPTEAGLGYRLQMDDNPAS